MGRGSFAGFVPFGRSPFGDCTCSGRMNRPCAKALLRKILVTPDFRRCWTPACGANRPHLFFTFPKRTVGQIDKYSGFWYNEYKKRRICHCTLPIQGLLLSAMECEFQAGFEIAPYLSRDYCFGYDGLESSRPKLHLTYPGIIALAMTDWKAAVRNCTLPIQGLLLSDEDQF